MMIATLLLFVTLFPGSAIASPAATTRPAAADNGWDAKWFAYDHPDQFVVEESTPTAAQVDFHVRPPQFDDATDEKLSAIVNSAKPRTIGGVNLLRLRFRDADGEVVPVLLCTPAAK